MLLFGLLGFEPAEQPGGLFKLRPQLGDLQGLETNIHTARGPIHFKSQLQDGAQHFTITSPVNLKLNVIVTASASSETGPLTTGAVKDGWRELPIPTGRPTSIRISAR